MSMRRSIFVFVMFFAFLISSIPIEGSGTMRRASLAADGTQANGDPGTTRNFYPSISDDGRFVAFQSYSTNLVPNDTNGVPDIFVKDMWTGEIRRVSVATGGIEANNAPCGSSLGGSYHPQISGNGRFVVFSSCATNLVSGDTNGVEDIFLHDLQTGTTVRVSRNVSGAQATVSSHEPDISTDGRYVVFLSGGANPLDGNDSNGSPICPHRINVFLRDMQTGATVRVSRGITTQADPHGCMNGNAGETDISGDGRYVFWSANTTNVVSGCCPSTQIYKRDLQTGFTAVVSVSNTGAVGNNDSGSGVCNGNFTKRNFSVSYDGRYVVFSSQASNLVDNDTNGLTDIFLRDTQTGTTERVNLNNFGEQTTQTPSVGGNSCAPAVSDDARFVAFVSVANNLDDDDDFALWDVFLRDRALGVTQKITRGPHISPEFSTGNSVASTISSNGRYIAFQSLSAVLVPNDTNRVTDIFFYDAKFSTSLGKSNDFDGDGTNDIAVFRPSSGVWYSLDSTNNNFRALQWGSSGDRLVPADYDGDGRTDYAVFRPSLGRWFILLSSSSSVMMEDFGLPNDIPTPNDFDGDGKADLAVYRDSASGGQSYFIYRGTSNNPNRNATFIPWGTNGDKPVVGDYDGDGRADAAVFRPSNRVWYLLRSTLGFYAEQFGLSTDRLVPADFDGDRWTDIAVFRPSSGIWYIRQRSMFRIFSTFQWGVSSDALVPTDFDGDGQADIAIFRPSNGTWWQLRSRSRNNQLSVVQFGSSEDVPVPLLAEPN